MAHDLIFGKTGRDWSCGSILLPKKQQKILLAKVDDVRYDIRRAGSRVAVGILCLSAALGFMGLASVYRTAETASKQR